MIGKQFIADAFKGLFRTKKMVHVRVTSYRPATNGIAERFITYFHVCKVFSRRRFYDDILPF
jgi:transposase InsO family protein